MASGPAERISDATRGSDGLLGWPAHDRVAERRGHLQDLQHELAHLVRVVSGGCGEATREMPVCVTARAALGAKGRCQVRPRGGQPPRLQGQQASRTANVEAATIEVGALEPQDREHTPHTPPLPSEGPSWPLKMTITTAGDG